MLMLLIPVALIFVDENVVSVVFRIPNKEIAL